jgi:hypothetical protein
LEDSSSIAVKEIGILSLFDRGTVGRSRRWKELRLENVGGAPALFSDMFLMS